MIKVGIVGGSGYTGGELLRILLQHPEVQISFVFSTTKAGMPISKAHPDLLAVTNLEFTQKVDASVAVLFLCLGHGNSSKFLQEYTFSESTKIIDLSNEFRLKDSANFQNKSFVYGLPEFHRSTIAEANYIANPGCFATAIQLALLPLADAGLLTEDVHVNATTGSTGAGVQPSSTTHFSWRNNNISWYKPFSHQHLSEIQESLDTLQKAQTSLFFLPQRGNFTRGIFATAYTAFNGTLEEAKQLYAKFYQTHPFTQLSEDEIHLKQVVNTNYCHLHLLKHGDTLLITSAIDNLLKGASGQAVQNMNLMFGLEESTGLQLKGSYF